MTTKTFRLSGKAMDRPWHVIDAKGRPLGRVASEAARLLMGKHKPTYTAHVDTGDFVVVTNAAKFKLTGSKAETMMYPRYSFHPGGYKEIPFHTVMKRYPERVIETAVRRMLPKNALGRHMLEKLKVYKGEHHPHGAQKPEPMEIKS